MRTYVIDRSATSTADADTIFALLADGATWPEWSPLGSFQLLEPGDGVPEGVGALRLFTTGLSTSRERVVEREPGRRLVYELEAGLPLRDYRAEVSLEPSADGGTVIRWCSTFSAKIPGTGRLFQRQLGNFIGRTVDGLAAATTKERQARS